MKVLDIIGVPDMDTQDSGMALTATSRREP